MSQSGIELVYELSPMQQAMLFSSLNAPGSGVYVVQLRLRLSGRLDVEAFERAWRFVVGRHAVLRTGFYWEDAEKPLQVVYQEVELEIRRESWRGLDSAAQAERLQAFLDADRERGFDLAAPPLLRLALFELGAGSWQLVWTQHHILTDGWSQGLLLKELFTCYEAFIHGRQPALGPARPYREHIAWLQRQDPAAAEAFWRASLAGLAEPTLLAGGDGRPGWQAGFRDSRKRRMRLSAETTAALHEMARQGRLTLNTLVQGAWALVLAHTGGRDDVVFGSTVAGRPPQLPGVESILGLFINTLPVRAQIDPERGVLAWLTDLQDRQVAARDFEHAPLFEIQTWSELPPGVALFDNVLIFESYPLDSALSGLLPDLTISDLAANELTNYPLNLVVFPGAELALEIVHDAGRVDGPTAARLLERLTGLLLHLAGGVDPETKLRDLPVLLAGERQQVLVEWNATWSGFPRAASLPELFAAVAAAQPEAPAVVEADGEVWSYRRLDAAASRLALHLAELGIAPGARVGVALERSADLVVALLAILQTGAAYVPLDPAYPDERLAFMLEDAGVGVAVVQERTRERLAAFPSLRLVSPDAAAGESASTAPPPVPAEALAYVIYTSGSTGRPKGVAVPHRAIVRLVEGTDYLMLQPDDRLAFNANTSFDAATFEIWATLLHGAALVVVAQEVLLSPAGLAALVERERITVLHLTAALFAQVAGEAPELLSRPRCVLFGGEASAPAAVARALEDGCPQRLLQMYGPTESTTFATWQEITAVDPEAPTIPIGRPLANTTAFVVDPWQDLAPLDAAGELVLGGEGLAWGYLGRPDLTAERFVPDPWSGLPGARLYRTGDLAARRPDGVLEFQGRIDQQVKIRGFRIEPGEVEAVLAGIPGVQACAVLARRDDPRAPGEVRLVAYAVPAAGEALREAALREALGERLPAYMVPAAWVILPELPLTPNGKVDRRALPAPEVRGAEEHEAPSGPIEELLAGLWAEVLGVDRVGVHDDFFALGGHSLRATQVVSRMQGLLGVELPLRTLFEAPTVAALARAVRAARQEPTSQAPPIVPVPRTDDLPASFAQQRLWFLDQLEPGSSGYNIPVAVRLTGELSLERLERIFTEVVRRHEALRTTFEDRGGRPVQVIGPPTLQRLPVADLSHLPGEEREARARRMAVEEARKPFDLQRGPLLRLGLVRMGAQDHLLLVTVHHIVSDGWSMGVLLREIAALHEAFAADLPSPLPELPVQYADFAVWQRSWLTGDVLQAQLDAWKRQLDGAPQVLELPTDRPRPPVPSGDGTTRPVALPAPLSAAVRDLCRREGATPFMVLLATWAALLGRDAGQEDVLIGTPIAGRNRREIEDLIGFFVNTLVMRVRLGAEEAPSFLDLVANVRQVALDSYAHQDLPFERLVEELAPERDLSRPPLFQVMFALQNAFGATREIPGLTLSPMMIYDLGSKFDLSLTLSETPDGLAGYLEHNTDLFDGSTVARLLARFEALLDAAAVDPETPLADLPALLAGERQQVLLEWNDTAHPLPREASLHGLFERWARERPEAPAVLFAEGAWSFAELDRRADALALRLRNLGVGPEVFVGVLAAGRPELALGMLAVLKAGGAFLPLDPSWPLARRTALLEDAAAHVLLGCRDGAPDEGVPPGCAVALLDEETGPIGPIGPIRPISPDQAAYLIYTSGSTGRPKGVVVGHGAAVAFALEMAAACSFGEGERFLQFASPGFDVLIEEVFPVWSHGGAVVFAPQEELLTPTGLERVLHGQGVTVLELPTPYWHEWVDDLDRRAAAPPTALRRLLVGGEKASLERLAKWGGHGVPLVHVFGLTETTVTSTIHRWDGAAPGRDLPIGRPVGNTWLYVLDRGGAPVPCGIPGELYIGGSGVARGYLGRPELTAERFVPDPFGGAGAAGSGARVYRTGDLARYRADGTLDFLGRIDEQVKIRGFRVEPGEITAVLEQHPAVSEAFVAVRDVRLGDRRLVAWVVPAPGCTLNPEALRAQVGERLPDYMVPTEIVEMAALPRTTNGKIDRRALPVPEAAPRPAADEAPRTQAEELLAGIWCAALGLPSVGRDEDFFALGGHSLLATQVVSRIRNVLGVDLPLRVLFEAPTLAALARAVLEARQDAAAEPPLVPLPRTPAPPLSFAQQRLWLVDQLEPDSAAYNLASPVRIEGPVAPGLLERIFHEIVRRHEVLRTGFAHRPGGPVQVIAPPGDPAGQAHLGLVDLSCLPAARREKEALRLVHADARLPFDLRRAPLLRLTLVRLAEARHLLLMTMHHIVSDGWSVSVLVREVAALWAAFSQGRPSPLPELPVQYADFAVWQRSWLQEEVLAAQLAFWRERLAGAPAVLELATDRPRPARPAHRGGVRFLALPSTLSAAIHGLCGRQGATPFMTLLAAWAALLGRHAGQDDVVVGAPVAGRKREEIEDLIGFFVNTLALRVRWSRDGAAPSFADLLHRVRRETLDAFAHQDLPFERLVEEVVSTRNLAHPPVFQVLFALQNVPPIQLELPGLALEQLDVASGTAKLDLTLSLGERPAGFAGALEYDADLFDATTAERLLDRFAAFLEAVTGDPGLPVTEVPVLRPAERHQVEVEWNDTRTGYPRDASLPALFAAVARELPQEPAIVAADGEVWTYQRLDEASSRLARHLQSLGVAAETAVGLALERSPELIAGALAILKAGGFYVPLDASYPDERLAFMLADTGARTVLVHERTRERMEALGDLRLVDASLWSEAPERLAGERLASASLPAECLAYVIYTSGSTGRPKGVAVPHRAVVRLVRSTNYVRLGPGDRTGHVANVSFDAATYEIWGALLTGAAAVVIPREVVVSPPDFAAALREQRVTSMFLTSALFTKMSREAPGAFATLHELLVGGEAVDPVAARTVLAGRPPRRLLNGYGPTESTTFAVWHPIRDVPEGAAGVPIGQPLANTTLWVLDPWQAAVPAGAAGELCLGGDGLARGYLHRPELTAERFVPHPWGNGERLYRTGDLVRQRADGAVLYLGRLDAQVKIRGFRIEPGEIEAVLAGHPAVRECAVLARRDEPGDALLTAYAVVFPEAAIDNPGAVLRVWLQERLPDFMIPSAWVFLDALPLTANGKLDRRALPAPGAGREGDQGHVPPADRVEETLVAIWTEVLQRERIGVLDNFFALGGHSLLATQVVTRIRETLGVDLPLRRIFEEPTIRGLAGDLRQAPQDSAPALARRVAAEGEEPPLSFAQQRLWLIDQLEPGNPAYNIHLAVRITGPLSVEALEQTFGEIVRRHETLRTTFAQRAGRPVQVIAPDSPGHGIDLRVLDLSLAPEEAREEWARELALEEARHPFDLQAGPLLRLGLLRLDEGDHLLLLTLHHAIADGWSMNVLLREIGALYPAFLRGEPSPLPALPLQYADFARWQRGWLTGEVLEQQLSWWRRRLAGAPPLLELPTDRPRPAIDPHAGASLDLALPPSLSAALHELCRRHDATPFMALLAAWAVLLGRHAHQEDVLIGTPIAGRNRREIEDLIGCFVNTLVLRTDLSVRQAGPSFQEILGQVRATALEVFTHQDLPFERVVEALVTERHLAYAPLVQVFFALQNAPGDRLEVSGLSFAPLDLHSGIAKFDLFLALWEQGTAFAGALEYKTDLFDQSTAERLLGRFASLLAAAVEDPHRAIADLPLLLPEERQQALLEWNDTERPDAAAVPGAGLCLHELFAAQVARTPDAVALVHGRERLTYRELAVRAGGLAHRLRRLGIGPEMRVAVCLERSPALVASLLGTLAAGGAYVPIDPAYPAERRAWLLEDSGATVLVTRGRLSADLPGLSGRGARRVRTIDLDAEEIPDAELVSGTGGTGVTPDHLAYVIYTSGSTGRPKGVAIEHRSPVHLAGWARQIFSDDELDGVLAGTSVCFDLSVFEIFVPLACGGRVILADHVLELPQLPAAAEVRLVNTVPSAAAELLRSGGLPASVRTVNLAGEPLAADLAERLYATGTVERVLNLYGPSEDTTYSTGALVPRDAARPPAIGRPLPGTRVRLVDRRGVPVPPGVPGELWLAGTGLARGYLDRPELTAERFSPDAIATRPGGRIYRTGDLARFRPDGELEFLRRIDQQVKVRGFRIELGEVEAALHSHPGIEDCAVQVRDDRAGSRLLVAYVAGAEDALPTPAALRDFLSDKLPDYMIPSSFVALPALPRTSNGKVDWKALPVPGHSAVGTAPAAPGTPLEEALASIWREILGHNGFGIHDSFFAIGGHSLLATQVVARVRDVLGIELPLRHLFEAPTIAQLARILRGATSATGGAETVPQALPGKGVEALPPITRAPRDGSEPPLSFAQHRLWLLDQLDPDLPAYNLSAAVRLAGELSIDALERAFAEIVRRHETLRTTFALRAGQPVQLIAPDSPGHGIDLRVFDLSHAPEEAREEWAHELALEEARHPFDLQRGPLLRLGLLRLGAREHLLLLTAHQIIADGGSVSLLLREVGALYPAFLRGEPSPLSELPLQYADFARWQRSWLQGGEILEHELAWWRRQLAGAPALLELPTDRPRPPAPAHRGAAVPLTLPPGLSDAVQEVCRREEMPLFALLLAAWAVVLGRHAGQDDLVLGSPVTGRHHPEIQDLIGHFVNTLALRVGLRGVPSARHASFRDLLAQMRETVLEASAHQDLPFERLVETMVPERDPAVPPLIQVAFSLADAPAETLELAGLTLSRVHLAGGATQLDLSLALNAGPAGVSGALEYSADLFDRTTAERFLAHLAHLLASAAEDPGRPLSGLRLMDAAEELQLLADLNPPHRGERSWALPATVHDLFLRQARQAPDRIAAVGSQGALTYREIDERSTALAAAIRKVLPGAGLDRRIGLLADPDPQILIGMMGILKAGGGFVPIDPRHPDERVAWILEDSSCEVLVTDRGHLAWAEGLARAAARPRHILCLDGPLGNAGPAAAAGLLDQRSPCGLRSLAYAVYTSGSTGRPKGVQVSHESLGPMLLWGCDYFGLGEHTRVLQSLSFCFDFGIFEHLTTVLAGGTLLYPGEAAGDPAACAREIVRHGVDTLHATPAFARELAAQGTALDSLAIIHLGGEALSRSVVARLQAAAPRATVYNGYGPTEATINSSIYRIQGRIEGETTLPIGRRSADNALYVLDRAGRLAPRGARGELHVGGIGVARGYLNRPDLTAERFVPDPFGEIPGGRLYRTGDLVRLLPEGDLEILGRIDDQVKIRGFRIELGEIEALLKSHPAVEEAVVLVREDARDRRLVAYVVPDRTDRTDPSDPTPVLAAWLRKKLPDYMIPSAFVTLKALPLSPTGKVDRRALPAPDRPAATAAHVAPGDALEEALAGIWQEILGLDRVGIHDNFFTLGGHSLLATQVVSRMRETLSVEVPLRRLFETPTIAGLARALRS